MNSLWLIGEKQYSSGGRGGLGKSKSQRMQVLSKKALALAEHQRVQHDAVSIDELIVDERLYEYAAAQFGDKTVPLRFQFPNFLKDVAV
jgi:hypothetical protein